MTGPTPPESAAAVCASCGHEAPATEMIPDLKFDWTPTGDVVCRDVGACFERWYANARTERKA